MNNPAYEHKMKWFARLGYGARGLIYTIVGGLSLLSAIGAGGDTVDSRGAIQKVLQQPLGNTMLVILVAGLLGYVGWRLIQAIKDTDKHGTSIKGFAVRGGLFISAATHAVLAYYATTLLFASGSSGGGSEAGKSFIASTPGQIFLMLAGLAVIGAGAAHIIKGFKARFEKYMEIPAKQTSWVRPLCQFGLIARGAVWLLIGWFMIRSALWAQSGDIAGMGEALDTLATSPYGTWLLGIAAAGLFAFGLYSFLEAAYRRINA
ncbi:DUF1206 domain-containing protein [Marinobacter sp. 1_MG-2023]|uniref:DUF1206 domain-containing protein n=1 Tax=Marinobacter sp. 1_MG-2023 TaxID=3062627 RepID=UPI0026E121F0|nr:DUF1206 domain-containing protein [Marinobacter sp. 1_MG-2023]MDO6822976.1 DUF1206 domain-containing protein [Marinobacter sp. 1_MG-2023]